MIERIIIAGAGGQGIILFGKVLAEAALRKRLNLTWFPSYGAEVRGGSAHCMVIMSSLEISSPYIDKADTLIIMNEPSLLKFMQRIENKGLLFINSSLVNSGDREHKSLKHEQFYLPFTETAIELGNIKVANMVALGAYVKKRGFFSKQEIFTTIEEITPAGKKGLIDINKKAIEEGMELLK